jgi:hypothetical protein
MKEKMAIVAAAKYAMNDEERSVAKKAWLDGYGAAYELIEKHIQFLESQLREAQSKIMRLEAERQ